MRDLEFVDPRQLLNEIRASIRGPWTASEADDHSVPKVCPKMSSSEEVRAIPMSFGGLSPAVDEIIRKDTARRMACLKALREGDSLTVQEAADLLGYEPETVKSQFWKLRQLGLIEQAGCRETSAGIQAVYRLNARNPALEFVLAPSPGGMRSPHEVAGRRDRVVE